MVDYHRLRKIDFFRNFFTGAVVPVLEVILMLIFIKSFQAGIWEKTALIVMSKSSFVIGMPLSIWAFRRQLPINQVVFFVCLAAGIGLWFTAIVTSWESLDLWARVLLFLFLVALVSMPFNGLHGVLSEFYNYYPKKIRGKLYVTSNIALFTGGTFFAIFYDYLLGSGNIFSLGIESMGSRNEINYEPALWAAGFSLMISAVFSYYLPQVTFSGSEKPNLRNWLKILRKDSLFSYVLVAWSLLGIANLWLVSYRTNLLVEEKFGFNYDESVVILLLIIVPQITYLIFNYPMALFFDRYNFIFLRILINISMGLYIGFFFVSSSFYGQLVGAFFYGIFTSGGNLAWKLWVYKVVPSGKVSSYMNIHTVFTGFRMMISPVFGLIGLYSLGPVKASLISLVLLSISTGMLFYLIPIAKNKFIH